MINTFDWFSKWSVYNGEKTAIKIGESGETYTYRKLNEAANWLVTELKSKFKLGYGDRVAIISDNSIYQILLFAAAQKSGIILVPLNFRLAPQELDYMLQDSGSKLCFYNKQNINPDHLAFENPMISITELEKSFEHKAEGTVAELKEDDPVFILYTSGTTGFPKGAVYTHKMLFWNSINTALSLNLASNTTTLNCMPLFHTGGWNVFLTPVLHHGGTLLLFNKFEPAVILDCIEEERLDLFMGVPTMLKMIADEPDFVSRDLSSLKYLIVGGESMPIPLIDMYHRKGIPVRQGYGLTEAGPNLTSLHQDEAKRKEGSIGKPNFYVDIRIVDDHGNDVQKGERGELIIGGPMVSPAYWNNEKATKESRFGTWLRTGDVALQDDEDFIYIVDRKKNMYISGGENVYPVEVERVLLSHPSVKEAVVIGVPHEKWGECGVAFIVGDKDFSEQEIKDFCSDKLAKFKIPSVVVNTPEIPKNDTGKLNRKVLKASYLEKNEYEMN
ncbi:long-chain fatty acid--CoA ligase [Robertkochia marina]|uniref:Long-chain fatty acid--CoA ligase n=1 Tax=Robertkochia marina TaxID=1227945 RepID=A0A4S3M149_9FLAO|nr:AMP-binding protein [Robertkochia marina]THD68081.1 long-chain fatty acid--CoA ligase [Robertkochia marina]TRZ42633.1 long-chain fatty acid--CoA ligase [Robertkochia marina]